MAAEELKVVAGRVPAGGPACLEANQDDALAFSSGDPEASCSSSPSFASLIAFPENPGGGLGGLVAAFCVFDPSLSVGGASPSPSSSSSSRGVTLFLEKPCCDENLAPG